MFTNEENQLALHYYREDPNWTNPNLRFTYVGSSYRVLDGSTIVVEQANQFDAHQVVLDDSELSAILALAGKTRVDIEHLGVGVIAKGVIISPSQQIADTGVGKITLTIANLTEECAWVPTGLGYRDAQEIAHVTKNLGDLTFLGHSDYNYAAINKDGIPGYDDFGRAVTVVTPGRATGWSATYASQPGVYVPTTAPVDWTGDVFGGYNFATFNGNTITADPAHTQAWDGGGVGYPMTWDMTHDFSYVFQVVDTQQVLQSGLSSVVAIGQFSISYGFFVHGGVAQVSENGALGAVVACPPNSSFTVAYTASTGKITYFINGTLVYTSAHVIAAPLAPIAAFASQQAEVANAIVYRIAPDSALWWKVAYDDITQLAAMIQLAQDTNLYVRQAKDGVTPARRLELGAYGTLTKVRIIDGTGGDPARLQANPHVRVVKTIQQDGPDFTNVVNVATPLGGGTGDTQVTLEHLWRLLHDANPLSSPNFGRYAGGYRAALGDLFPERDPNYEIYRTAMDAGGYQYYMKSLQSVAQWGEMYGGTPDSTYTYQTDSNNNLAYTELTERGLYSSWIGKFRKNDQPHYLLQIDCTYSPGDVTPRAGDMLTVDYTGYGLSNGVFFNRLKVNDTFYVMKVTRTFGAETYDTLVLSNLGRYKPDDNSSNVNTARQVQAIQQVTNTALSVSILGTTYRELDSGQNPNSPGDHSIIYPIKILPTCFEVQAAYFHVEFLPFRQTVYETVGGLHHHQYLIEIPDHSHPPEDNLATDHAAIANESVHYHNVVVVASQIAQPSGQKIHIASTPTDITPDRYVWMGGDGFDAMTLIANGHGGTMRTSSPEGLGVDLTPTSHPHLFTQTTTIAKTHTFAPITGFTDFLVEGFTEDAGLHQHTMTPQILDSLSPAAIQVWIDSGDGTFVDRTSSLVNLLANAVAQGSGFTGTFEFECARFINAPGRTVRLKFVSIGDDSNPYGLGALGISATLAASYGGLGQVIRQQQ